MSADRMPGAVWAPIPETGSGGRYLKTQVIYHSTGTRASAEANRRYFAQAGVKAESTFIVDYDGLVLQVMGGREKADANLTASRRAISVEVVGVAGEPYTDEQVRACIRIGRWALAEHDIAPQQVSRHDGPGLGWHVMWGAPGPWTAVRGKTCPGGARIAQVRDQIIPAVCAGATEEVDVDETELRAIVREEVRAAVGELLRDELGKAVKVLHADHVTLLRGGPTHPASLTSIAQTVGVPGTREEGTS